MSAAIKVLEHPLLATLPSKADHNDSIPYAPQAVKKLCSHQSGQHPPSNTQATFTAGPVGIPRIEFLARPRTSLNEEKLYAHDFVFSVTHFHDLNHAHKRTIPPPRRRHRRRVPTRSLPHYSEEEKKISSITLPYSGVLWYTYPKP